MGGSGLPALIYAGAWLGNEFGMEAIACGRGALSNADCVLEICGKFLFFTITLRAGDVTVAAQPMDAGDPPDLLLRIGDNENGWDTIRRLVASLERNQVKSLQRPIESGEAGDPDAWRIA
jgi:hypothetical protein